MRGTSALLIAALLAGCSETVPVNDPFELPLRNPTAQIASQTDVAAEDIDGAWAVRQYAPFPGWATFPQVILDGDGADLRVEISYTVCSEDNLICLAETEFAHYRRTGPGRWSLDILPPGATAPFSEVWVLWVDVSRRTMAIGDPDGTFVLILDRSASGGGDRIAAAREVLDWYGYDLNRLEAP